MFAVSNADRAKLEWYVETVTGAFWTPIADEIIAAAVSRVLIVIEGSSTATLRAGRDRRAQPRHYVIVPHRLFDQVAILRRAAGR